MKRLTRIGSVLCVVACLLATTANADTARITGSVKRIMLTADGTWGGCVVELSEDPADALPNCRSPWITFSCDGTYTDPVRAYRMLDQAQLGLATGLRLTVDVDDTKTQDGFCFGFQVKILSY